MRVRSITTCALGLAAALSIADSLAAQQDTTRLRRPADQRIPITKEAPGEVVTVRVDTVYVTRYDTVSNTITRVDTITVTPPAPVVIPTIRGPMFWGLMAGTTWPWGNIDRVYTNGYHVAGVLGWESQQSPIGLRLDGGVSQLGREETLGPSAGFSQTNIGSGTPLLMHLAADLKLKVVNVAGWAFYGIGGGNYDRYRGIALASDNDVDDNCDFQVRGECYQNATTSWSDKFGFNFGLGTDFHIGSQDMFLEARYFATLANGARSWRLPISLGVRYF
jgi:hypothetical protein